MTSPGLFRTAVAGIRSRSGLAASTSISRSSLPYRPSPRICRNFASSTTSFSAASHFIPSSSQVPDPSLTSPLESSNAITQASADATSTGSDIVQGGFEFLQPWVPTIHNLADTLHLSGPHAHALSIFILAFAVRTAVTLPVTLWQRAKTKKLTEHVLPEWEAMKEQIPLAVRVRCRRAGKSYEEFEAEVRKELKEKLADLLRKHNASPLPAFVGPATVSIPIFLVMTALVRQAALDPSSPFASEVLPWWSPSPELAQQFKSSTAILADRGFDEATIAKLKGTMGGPTLADKDPTMIGPVSFGMLTMANTELTSWTRRSIAKIRDVTSGNADAAARTAGKLLQDGAKPAAEIEKEQEPRRVRIITNALRVMAIAFIPIACQAPGVSALTSVNVLKTCTLTSEFSFDSQPTGAHRLLAFVRYLYSDTELDLCHPRSSN